MADQNNVDFSVLIAGAGPTGLILALELVRRNITFKIIDKSPTPSKTSKALAIHSRSLEMLENMGLVEEFIDKGSKIHNVNAYADGKRITHLTFDELDGPFPFVISIPQYKTEEILIHALEKQVITIDREVNLTRVLKNDSIVECELENKNGEKQKVTCNWLVGCDGAHSTVRHELGLEFVGERYPETWILGDVEAQTVYPDDEINLFNTESGLLAFFPYGGNRFRIVADKPSKEKHEQETTFTEYEAPTLEELQKTMDERCPTKVKLSNPKWTSSFAIHRRHSNHYKVNRVFLAGDAAHIHSPAGGQGMNTGMQDSFNLGWKLANVEKGISSDSILDSYEQERLAIARSVLKMTDFLTKVNTTRNPIAMHVRNRLAPILSAQEVIQKRVTGQMSELSLNYRASDLVEEDADFVESVKATAAMSDGPNLHDFLGFKHGPEAGDRAPDGFLQKDPNSKDFNRLFELMRGNEFSLLVFVGNHDSSIDSEIEKVMDTVNKFSSLNIEPYIVAPTGAVFKKLKNKSNLYLDMELSLHHVYGAANDCLYLVRPDGYIGYRSQPINAKKLETYLNRFVIKMHTLTK